MMLSEEIPGIIPPGFTARICWPHFHTRTSPPTSHAHFPHGPLLPRAASHDIIA